MIRLAIALLVLIATGASASPILVRSGEHDGFTRLVMEYGAAIDWQVGRTDDGYELRIAKQTPDYDFTEAFKLIGKSRLAGIWIDPATKALRLGVACACHAIPFEFRPGIIVIDLRDGPPPKGSSFELPISGETSSKPSPSPAASGYDWTQLAVAAVKSSNQPQSSSAATLAPMPSSEPDLQNLRQTLLQQLSRGAAQGVVDMVEIAPKGKTEPEQGRADLPTARISLGEMAGLDVRSETSASPPLDDDGQACIPADSLALATWGDETPVSEQLAAATAGLIGEFDKPVPAALERAIKLYLYIGFGAEARQLMQAFPTASPDKAIWESLAKLVDGESDPNSAFNGQLSCDTPAALWAILAMSNLPKGDAINGDAAYLAFSALPVALRRQLGPVLADKFLAIDEAGLAAKVQSAILRAPGDAGPDASLLAAEIAMSEGQPSTAEAQLQNMVDDPGPGTPAAVIGIVEARAAQNLPVTPDMVTALEAIVQERSGGQDEHSALRALVLAKAAASDFGGALADIPKAPLVEPDVWRILSLLGTDDALLTYAVTLPKQNKPQTDAATRSRLAKRLLDLGMADSALMWLPDESQADPNLLARIHLQRHDGRSALRVLTGLKTPDAMALQASALQQLGDEAAAARVFATMGDSASELRSLGHAEAWDEISKRGDDSWKSVASVLENAPENLPAAEGTLAGPLAKGKQLVDDSANTRAAVAALLATVAGP